MCYTRLANLKFQNCYFPKFSTIGNFKKKSNQYNCGKRAFSFGKRFFVSLISLVCSNNAIYLYVLIFFKLFLIETQEKQIKNEKRYFEKNKLQQIITCAMNFWVCFDHLYQFESIISSFYWRFLNIFWKNI